VVVYFRRGEPKGVSAAWVERRRVSGVASNERQYLVPVHVLYGSTCSYCTRYSMRGRGGVSGHPEVRQLRGAQGSYRQYEVYNSGAELK
jgi:hypothetical protein